MQCLTYWNRVGGGDAGCARWERRCTRGGGVAGRDGWVVVLVAGRYLDAVGGGAARTAEGEGGFGDDGMLAVG